MNFSIINRSFILFLILLFSCQRSEEITMNELLEVLHSETVEEVKIKNRKTVQVKLNDTLLQNSELRDKYDGKLTYFTTVLDISDVMSKIEAINHELSEDIKFSIVVENNRNSFASWIMRGVIPAIAILLLVIILLMARKISGLKSKIELLEHQKRK